MSKTIIIFSIFVTGLFFFYKFVDYIVLHSFPTRRSSDLDQAVRGHEHVIGVRLMEDLHAGIHQLGTDRDRHRRTDDAGDEDRKSTRLNSRHSSNSYAVFCLKKKKIIK